MSLATIIVPFKLNRVDTGCLVNSLRMSSIGKLRSILTASPSPALRNSSGINSLGLSSNFSIQIPSLLILALIFLSAEQLTPSPTGQEAPCRGKRTTRISWAKYFPPNCAPSPILRDASNNSLSNSTSLNALPVSSPVVGSPS